MKIIAAADKYTYIVEMTHREINKLSGVAAGGPYNYDASYKVGQTFGIERAWDHMYAMRTKRDDAIKSAENLRALAKLLDAEIETVKHATEEPLP